MNIIYTLSVILITLSLNAVVTWAIPYVKQHWNAFITDIKRKFTRKQTVNCSLLEERIANLETQYKQRQINFKSRVREEVKEYLKELQK